MAASPLEDDIAPCVECGEDKPVWNDDGYTEMPDGSVKHENPVCLDCVNREREWWAQYEAWDAYESGRPMASDDY